MYFHTQFLINKQGIPVKRYSPTTAPNVSTYKKVYFKFQILERPSIGEYWNISGVPVLL